MDKKIFNALANGSKFKYESNKKSLELFRKGQTVDVSMNNENKEIELVNDLDFFGYGDQQNDNSEPKSKETFLNEQNQDIQNSSDSDDSDDSDDDNSDDNDNNSDNNNNDDNNNDDNNNDNDNGDSDEDESSQSELLDQDQNESIDLTDEATLNLFRKRMKIRVNGGDIPVPIVSFEDMYYKPEQEHLKRLVLRNIEHATYKEPTPIQMQSIPVIIQHRDLIATAPTGSGKTAAYLLPLIPMLNAASAEGVRVLIISPSHELCCQIQREWKKLTDGRKFRCVVLTKSTVSGYVNNKSPVDIFISTPLRLIDTIEHHHLQLTNLKTIIFDEADKLFEDNFIEQLDKVLELCNNKNLQRIMFSATLPESIENLVRTILRDPISICIDLKNTTNENVKQELVFVGKEEGKLIAIRQLFQSGMDPPVLVFVQSKERAQQLYHELAYDGINIDVIHSDRPVQQRELIINKFRLREIWVLICTDLVARGLDFKGVNWVINFDFPQSGISYIHRIGRTGRAGKEGRAITYFTEDDYPMLRSIANVMKISGCEVPDWMLKLKKLDRKSRKRLAKGAIPRESISTVSVYDKKKRNRKLRAFNKSKQKQ